MQSAWSTMKLRESPRLLDAQPGEFPESNLKGFLATEDATESLVDCFLQAQEDAPGAVIVILTTGRGQERTRNLRVREEIFAKQLCNFLQARKGRPIREIGELALDFA
jgi:hypothetical protein